MSEHVPEPEREPESDDLPREPDRDLVSLLQRDASDDDAEQR